MVKELREICYFALVILGCMSCSLPHSSQNGASKPVLFGELTSDPCKFARARIELACYADLPARMCYTSEESYRTHRNDRYELRDNRWKTIIILRLDKTTVLSGLPHDYKGHVQVVGIVDHEDLCSDENRYGAYVHVEHVSKDSL